jgi:hypothetical protein
VLDYRKAAESGQLRKVEKPSRQRNFRKDLIETAGAPPSPRHQADHKVERCLNGPDCAKTNGQWLRDDLNRTAGRMIQEQTKKDPAGTIYGRVRLERLGR